MALQSICIDRVTDYGTDAIAAEKRGDSEEYDSVEVARQVARKTGSLRWADKSIPLHTLLFLQEKMKKDRKLSKRVRNHPKLSVFFRPGPKIYDIAGPVFRSDLGRTVNTHLDIGMTGGSAAKRLSDKWRGVNISEPLRNKLKRLHADPRKLKVKVGIVKGGEKLWPVVLHHHEILQQLRHMATPWHMKHGLFDPKIRTFEGFEETTAEGC